MRDLANPITVCVLYFSLAESTEERKWFLICEEETRIDLHKLLTFLQQYDPSKVRLET